MSAWVATNTGLPSFKLVGPGVLMAGSRLVARVTGDSVLTVADPLAEVGVPTVYGFAGQSATLTRLILGHGVVQSHQALITGVNGRGVLVDLYENTGDPRKFKSGSFKYSNGVMRGAPGLDEREGKSRLVLDSPERLAALGDVLEQPGPVLIVLAAPAAGVPGVRCVAVSEVKYLRTGVDGAQQLDVTWESVPYPMDGLLSTPGPDVPAGGDGLAGVSGAVLTWGDCEAAGVLWGDVRTIGQISVALTGGSL